MTLAQERYSGGHDLHRACQAAVTEEDLFTETLKPHMLKVILVTFVLKGVKIPPGVSQLLG